MPTARQTTTEIIDYVLAWENALDSGDYIVTSAWTVPSGITASSAASTALTTTIRLTGGSTGRLYALVNTVTLHSGQKYQTPLNLSIGG